MNESIPNIVNKYPLLGEKDIYKDALSLLSESDSVLINLYGVQGSGKSHFLSAIYETLQSSKVTVEFITDHDGVDNLPKFSEGQDAVIVLDDVGLNFSKDDFKGYVQTVFAQNSKVKLIFSSVNQFFADRVTGVKLVSMEIGSRRFTYPEFFTFISNKNNGICIPDSILKNYYLFSTYCKNFNLIERLYDQLVTTINKSKDKKILPKQFLALLGDHAFQEELNKDLIIDYTPVDGSELFFSIREKDKSEKLRDIILKYYPEEQILKSVMEHEFENSFVEQAFNSQMNYSEKVLNLCFSYDPPVLIKKVLGPRDVICELNERGVGEACFAKSIEDKIKLILRNIGLNILDEPRSIEYHISQYEESQKLIESSQVKKGHKEFIVGLGISCYQDLELIFSEFIRFYSKYFFGSLQGFSNELKALSSHDVNLHRLTFGKYIELFRVFNRLSKDERYQVKLMNIGKTQLVPEKILKMLEELSSYRVSFSHSGGPVGSPSILRRKLGKVLTLSVDILNAFINYGTFPEIIKIKEINFDEFGRRLYVASGWEKNEIRFCMSVPVSSIDIYSYYYLLRKKHHISINPVILPRTISDNEELFASGEDYQKSSGTQKQQGGALIDQIDLKPGMRILDVGCGNGMTTLDLCKKENDIIIDAFDVSSSMIEMANKNLSDSHLSDESVNFYVQDAESFSAKNTYDLIFSNATLHWVKNGKKMYKELYDALKSNGQIAIHQGGDGCYRGLHTLVRNAIETAELAPYFSDWTYPIFYPKKDEMEHILSTVGFVSPRVISVESDGSEYPTLIEDFMNAGMLPYLKKLPEEKLRKNLKKTYLDLSKKTEVDKYTNRLYIFGQKGGDHGVSD